MKNFLFIIAVFIMTFIAADLNSQCNYSIVLYDSFGDGWDTGEVTISVAGVPVGTYTLAAGGGPETYYFSVNTGNTIHSTYTPSTWPTENEYRIYNSDNVLIFTDGNAGVTAPTANNTLVGIANCPACSQPIALTATSITQTSASLVWTSSAGLWNLEWGLAGFTQGTGTLITGTTTNPYPLGGLTSSTAYEFYVQANCGGSGLSSWSGPFIFSTSCSPANICTYTLYMNDQGNSWNGAYVEVIQNGVSMGTFTVPGGGTNTETVDLCAGSIIELLWYSGTYDNETSFDMQTPYSTSVYSWSAGGYPTPGIFHTFVATCTPPTCPDPTALSASNITINSADLGWTESGSATTWNIEWGLDWFTQGSGTIISGTNLNPYTLGGLASSTAYEFYVQSYCGVGDLSNWIGPFPFTTSCAPIIAPYYQIFDSGSLPTCWENTLGDFFDWTFAISTPTLNTGPENGDHTTGLGYFAYTEASNPNNPNKQADLLTPFIDISALSAPALSFWYNLYGAGMGVLHVDVYDGTWHNDEFLISGNQGDIWTLVFVDLTSFSSPVQVRFRGITGTSATSDMAIDDVRFDEMTTCPQPSMLDAQNISDSSADLIWNENGSATAWNIEWGLSGFTQGTGTIISPVTSNPYSLSGLSTVTSYSYYVQSDCGGDLSYWSGPFTFTTLIAPYPNPTPCEINLNIPDGGCIEIPIEVTGISGSQMGTDSYLMDVNLIIDHTWDGDLNISLISPTGVEVDLSTQNGNAGDDYGIIDGTCTQFTNFNMTGVNGIISAGIPPYLGSFIPEGDFTDFNDDSNPNGFWVLKICDAMASDVGTLEYAELNFELILPPAELIINELDCDQAINDTLEFIEIYDGGIGNYPLDGNVVVLYNGSSDQCYASYDLDGYTTNANGYFLIGNADVSGVDIVFTDNLLQNGTDAVALYAADDSDFPVGTVVTLTNLVDALVYHTNDAFDPQLLTLLNTGQPQINEDNLGNKDYHSCSRIPNGSGGQRNTYSYNAAIPTPGASNQAVPVLVWSNLTFTESLANNGSIGNSISLELNSHTFSLIGTLTQSVHYNASNIPAGLTVQIDVITDTTAVIQLTGVAVSHLDIDDISNLTISFLNSAYAGIPANLIIDNSKNNIVVDFFDSAPSTIIWNSGTFSESVINDGSIDNNLILSLYSETFIVSSGFLTESTHYSVLNIPAGLTVEIEVINDTSATISLTGNAVNHENVDDVANLEIAFLDDAFSGGLASSVVNYSQSNLIIDFLDQYFTDLDISIIPDTLYVCNLCVCPGPVIYITNTGDTDIPVNDSIFINYITIPFGLNTADTIILSSVLLIGDSISYTPVINITSTGIIYFETYIHYFNDQESSNDTVINIINSYQNSVDLGGINDTIFVSSYPYTLDAGLCTSPFLCTYLWSTFQNTQSIIINADGLYSVIVTDSYACYATDSVYVILNTGVNDYSLGSDILLYPNPNNGLFVVEMQNKQNIEIVFKLYDVQGQIIESTKTRDLEIRKSFNCSLLAKGVYYLEIDNGSGLIIEKIVVQ
ncbi:MAG: T9SS type A sorting domain-containing protein [Bacteroidota bacterium]